MRIQTVWIVIHLYQIYPTHPPRCIGARLIMCFWHDQKVVPLLLGRISTSTKSWGCMTWVGSLKAKVDPTWLKWQVNVDPCQHNDHSIWKENVKDMLTSSGALVLISQLWLNPDRFSESEDHQQPFSFSFFSPSCPCLYSYLCYYHALVSSHFHDCLSR